MLTVEITDDLPVYHYIKNGQARTAIARSEYSAAATINFLRWRGHEVRIERSEEFMANRKDIDSMAERHADRLRELDATGKINAGGFTNKLVNKMIELGYLQSDELDLSLHITPAGRAHMEAHPALTPEPEPAAEEFGYPIIPAMELTYDQLMSLSPKQKLAVLSEIGGQTERTRIVRLLNDFDTGVELSTTYRRTFAGMGLLVNRENTETFASYEITPLGRFLMRYSADAALPEQPAAEDLTPPVFRSLDELKLWWAANPEVFDLVEAAMAAGFINEDSDALRETLRRFEAKVWYERHNAKQPAQRAAVVDTTETPAANANWEFVLSLRSIRDDALAILENAAGEFGSEAARILRTSNEMLDEMLS